MLPAIVVDVPQSALSTPHVTSTIEKFDEQSARQMYSQLECRIACQRINSRIIAQEFSDHHQRALLLMNKEVLWIEEYWKLRSISATVCLRESIARKCLKECPAPNREWVRLVYSPSSGNCFWTWAVAQWFCLLEWQASCIALQYFVTQLGHCPLHNLSRTILFAESFML